MLPGGGRIAYGIYLQDMLSGLGMCCTHPDQISYNGRYDLQQQLVSRS